MHGVTVSKLISKMKLKNATPEQDTDKTVLTHPEVNRAPAGRVFRPF